IRSLAPTSPPLPYTTLFRSQVERRRHLGPAPVRRGDWRGSVRRRALAQAGAALEGQGDQLVDELGIGDARGGPDLGIHGEGREPDRKSTRLNSSHVKISYAV